MIWYCRSCMAPCEERGCKHCGEASPVPILPEDPCCLTELRMPWAGVLEDVLRQRAIPYEKRSMRGAALAIHLGAFGERFRFYVPYEFFKAAQELAEELFSQTEEDDPIYL